MAEATTNPIVIGRAMGVNIPHENMEEKNVSMPAP
jgi:hypothetical protein